MSIISAPIRIWEMERGSERREKTAVLITLWSKRGLRTWASLSPVLSEEHQPPLALSQHSSWLIYPSAYSLLRQHLIICAASHYAMTWKRAISLLWQRTRCFSCKNRYYISNFKIMADGSSNNRSFECRQTYRLLAWKRIGSLFF